MLVLIGLMAFGCASKTTATQATVELSASAAAAPSAGDTREVTVNGVSFTLAYAPAGTSYGLTTEAFNRLDGALNDLLEWQTRDFFYSELDQENP